MDIAILGGGIGGISTAIALKQYGFNARIYERHAHPTQIGAGIVLWPNAVYVLQQFGLLDRVKSVSGYPEKMQRMSQKNDNLGCIDIRTINELMGFPSLSILRRDLLAILLEKSASIGLPVEYSHRVTEIKAAPSGRTKVYFDNGEVIVPEIIIGADGRMRSLARQFILGSNAPVYQKFINWIGVCDGSRFGLDGKTILDFWGTGERFGIVPVNDQSVYWAAGTKSDHIDENNPESYLQELSSLFHRWPEPVKEVILRTPVQNINKIYVHDHEPVQCWHKNNVLMIGDAAHAPLPTSGQGACQAIEDAWHLAKLLKQSPFDLENVFQRFWQLRYEKTASIIHAARGFAGSLFNRDSAFCKIRNERSKNTNFSEMAQGMAKGWSRHLPMENA